MADEEMVVNWIRSQGWDEENLPSDEFRQMFDACLAGIKIVSQLDKVWHDYDAGEDCYEDSHEGRWVKRENKQKWHDLRKDPTDIPPKKDDVYSVEVWSKNARGKYGTALFSYALFKEDGRYDHWVGTIPVLWTELPKFDEE